MDYAFRTTIIILTSSGNVQIVFQPLTVVQPTITVGTAFTAPHHASGVYRKHLQSMSLCKI